MRKIVALLPMYACYWGGLLAFEILNRWPDGWGDGNRVLDKIGSAIFQVYNRGMCASADLNDWAGYKLWRTNETQSTEPTEIT